LVRRCFVVGGNCGRLLATNQLLVGHPAPAGVPLGLFVALASSRRPCGRDPPPRVRVPYSIQCGPFSRTIRPCAALGTALRASLLSGAQRVSRYCRRQGFNSAAGIKIKSHTLPGTYNRYVCFRRAFRERPRHAPKRATAYPRSGCAPLQRLARLAWDLFCSGVYRTRTRISHCVQ